MLALKRKLDDSARPGEVDAETQRNMLKEALQYYVLNFVYHHPEYSMWTMYGGSALRICHGLDRMSVDLDFEVNREVSEQLLVTLRKEVEEHFSSTYGSGPDLLTVKETTGRGLTLKFHVAHTLGIDQPSDQVHVKIDLNAFAAPRSGIERWPINRDQLSFVIKTYNMATMMASKLAAIFLRGRRGVGTEFYEEKGRDIYDLLWYMSKKIVPDLDYLAAKDVALADLRALFDRLTVQLNKVSDTNLRQDLTPLFVNRDYINHWLENWRESYLRLLDGYRIHTATNLDNILIQKDFQSDVYTFTYDYATEDSVVFQIVYRISEHWIYLREGDLPVDANRNLDGLIDLGGSWAKGKPGPSEKLRQYASLLHQKSEVFLAKANRVVLGDRIVTKVIRMTADHLNQREHVLLNKSALLSVELEDLLR